MRQAQHHQPVDGLDRIDGMSACDRDARLGADGLASLQNAADDRHRQFVDRHAHQRERHDRRAAHGVHVGDRVGGRDTAEVVSVVDDRHEEVGRGDEGLRWIELIHGRIVACFDADQQLGRHDRQAARALQNVRQHTGSDLAAAAAAVREGGQPDLGRCIHDRILEAQINAFTSAASRAGANSGARCAHCCRRWLRNDSSVLARMSSAHSSPTSPTAKYPS